MIRATAILILVAFVAACEPIGPTPFPRVSGNITYDGPVPPRNAVLEVRVVENANWPNPFVVGVHRIFDPGPSPIPFAVDYNDSQINPNTQYLLEAEIVLNGRVIYTNERPYFVITRGYPSRNLQVPMRRLR
jgi:uncharacterized lipoprotein YbaY